MFQRHPIQNESVQFITTNTLKRRKIFLNAMFAREAIETLYRVQQQRPFFLYGFVIMPDHCHFLLRVPEPETISGIMRVFKSGVSFNIGIGPLWQSRFHSKESQNAWTLLHYIHWNPVKAGLAETPAEYPWSSASGRWDVSDIDW